MSATNREIAIRSGYRGAITSLLRYGPEGVTARLKGGIGKWAERTVDAQYPNLDPDQRTAMVAQVLSDKLKANAITRNANYAAKQAAKESSDVR